MLMNFPLTGLIAASYTPFDATGRLNVEVIPAMAEYFREVGISGVFVAGTTGESHSLTLAERIDLTDAWCNAAPQQIPVIAHVGSNSQPDAIELASRAARAGVQGIGVMAPSFFKPATIEDLISYCEPIAKAAADVPFYYYHIPQMTGVEVEVAEFLDRASDRIPNLAGAKYSGSNLMDVQECLHAQQGRFDVLFGQDENLLAGLSLGLRGAIGSTYNYAPGIYHRVIEAFESGDMELARREQATSVQLVRLLKPFGVLAAGKEIMRLIGIDCGAVRSPLTPIGSGKGRELYEALKHLDVFSRPLSSVLVDAN
jgi:N-acetylneuraminate lyase